MKKLAFLLAGILAVLISTAIGYRFGTGHWPGRPSAMMADSAALVQPDAMRAASRRVLYWKNPDGKPAYAANPMKADDGRAFIPVYDDAAPDFPVSMPEATKAAEAPASKGEHKVKYYRNPMGLPDTSAVPKKDSMSMDYIPVYEDDDDDGSSVKVSLNKIQRAGVKSEPAEMRKLARPVNAPGIAKIDERTMREITLRADA